MTTLLITPPSPYARKVRIVAREKGLRVAERVVDPYGSDPDLVAVHPLAQVPALLLDDGTGLIDSPLIARFLDEQGSGPSLYGEGLQRHGIAQHEALANGALEMGVKWLLEKRRPESERSAHWMSRWHHNLLATLDRLEVLARQDQAFHAGSLTTVVALTWLDFRHPDVDWRTTRPALEALQSLLEARDSFRETRPA